MLGKSTKEMLPETLYFNERMLYDFNMEYYTPKNQDPFSSVGWFKEENEYFHPLSLSMSGETYGYHKLHEIMPIKDFFEMPNVMVEEILDSVSRGLKKREEAEAAKAKAKEDKNPDNIEKQLGAELRKAGIKLDR